MKTGFAHFCNFMKVSLPVCWLNFFLIHIPNLRLIWLKIHIPNLRLIHICDNIYYKYLRWLYIQWNLFYAIPSNQTKVVSTEGAHDKQNWRKRFPKKWSPKTLWVVRHEGHAVQLVSNTLSSAQVMPRPGLWTRNSSDLPMQMDDIVGLVCEHERVVTYPCRWCCRPGLWTRKSSDQPTYLTQMTLWAWFVNKKEQWPTHIDDVVGLPFLDMFMLNKGIPRVDGIVKLWQPLVQALLNGV